MKYIILSLFFVGSVLAKEKDFMAFDKGKVYELSADDLRGERIGPSKLKKDTVLRIQYKQGEWSSYFPQNLPENPDETTNATQQVVIKVEDKKSKSGFKILFVVKNTKDQPAEFVIPEDGRYYISISDDVVDNNEGEVEYEISISK